jgi:peptidyl-tRNA hydrolase
MSYPSKSLTDKELIEIEMMAGLGLRYEDIASIKGMCLDTLKKYADSALSRGKAKAKLQVAQTAYKMATSGKTPAMTIFWLKTQARWKDYGSQEVVNTVPESPVIQTVIQQLTQSLEQLATGVLDPKVAGSTASIANVLLKAVTQGEMEERLAVLEQLVQPSETLDLTL